ncbi:MAG: DUF2149 domain-containing protein [Pseudomonadota bacterium]
MMLKSIDGRQWQRNRFGHQDEEPLGPLANLLDLMLVFACGLIAALISLSKNVDAHFDAKIQQDKPPQFERVVEKGRELPRLPSQGQSGGNGYEAVGQVYRDPETGKLILIGK